MHHDVKLGATMHKPCILEQPLGVAAALCFLEVQRDVVLTFVATCTSLAATWVSVLLTFAAVCTSLAATLVSS